MSSIIDYRDFREMSDTPVATWAVLPHVEEVVKIIPGAYAMQQMRGTKIYVSAQTFNDLSKSAAWIVTKAQVTKAWKFRDRFTVQEWTNLQSYKNFFSIGRRGACVAQLLGVDVYSDAECPEKFLTNALEIVERKSS